MVALLEDAHDSHVRNGHGPAKNDPGEMTLEEAQALLEQMAGSLKPSPALGQLAQQWADGLLSAGDDKGDRSHAPLAAEEQLRKAQARYRALVEQIPAITFMAPLDGTVSELYVSPQIEQMLGFTAEEWLSNPILWYQQLHPDDKERWQADFARTLSAGEHFRSDYRFLSRDGRVVWIHGEAKVITDEVGRPLFLQGVAFDITERMEAEEKLRQNNQVLAQARDQAMEASRAKSAFLANMSHELRTPLHAIIGFAEMLQDDAADAGYDNLLPDLTKITGSARHLVSLISNILDLSKIEAGKMDLFLEDFELRPLIEEVVSTVLPLAQESGNVLEVRCSPDLGMVHADAVKLRQVLFNLLSNANKFTEHGSIVLEAGRAPAPSGEVIRLRVTDTGIGIAPNQKEKLFRSFSQGDDSTTRKYGGTGLGLAISHRFCQMMGGAITVQSELGIGSTFAVEFPTHVEADVAAPVESGLTIELRGSAGGEQTEEAPAILVIDADPQSLDLMGRFLAREGLRIVPASSGQEGLQLARDLRPAVITLDLTIPDMSSWEVLTALKADPVVADIPVVLFARAEDADQGCPLAAAEYLTKPIDWKRLSQLLGALKGEKSNPRVLVLDDDADCRELMTRAASQTGWEVHEAANGWVGLRSVVEAPPDLILLDLTMPEIDGFEFLRLLRASKAGSTIPVIVVTARELTGDERLRLSGSVHKILQKGALKRDELFGEIEALVTARLGKRLQAGPVAAGAPRGAEGVGDLKRRLEEAEGQRDEALAELRQLSESAEGAEAQAERERMLGAELELIRQQLREQQQSVELLRADTEEAERLQAAMDEAKAEIERLKEERDAALGWLNQAPAAPAAPEPPAELVDLVRQLQKEVEGLRSGAARPSEAAADGDEDRPRKRRRKPREAEKPAAPANLAPASPERDRWHVRFRDPSGRSKTIAGGPDEIRSWVEQGLLDPTGAQVSRSPQGPFDPIGHIEEFADLSRPTAADPRNLIAPAPDAGPEGSADRRPSKAGAQPRSEWMTWAIAILLGLVVAVVAGQKLFW